MKNTILKMAGVKDEKSFYKKYPTEAAFLKAHPKAKTQLKQFALGGIDANRQTYPKTITYSPQEWHQKNILAGNVMLGKNNDLNTMFKNNIYPQYTLPNDTVPISYSPVVKQLPMPQSFVDKNKGTFNYAAGQQLPKQANGGQMNAQAMQQFAGGGFFQDAGEGIGNYFKAVADTTLGTFGASNVIKDDDYSGYGANEMSNLNKTLQPITSAVLPMAANIVAPGSGAIVSAGQQAIGTMNPEDNTGLDENGNPKNPDAAKYQQAGQTVAQLGGIGAQIYGASKAPSTSGGIPNGGPIKRAMGGMQYAMGGEIQYANGGTGEINAEVEDNENAIGPNGEFTQFSGPTHAEGGIETDMAPGTMIFSDKLKMPGSKKSFADLNKLYDTNKEDDVLSNEKSNNTLKLTAMLMRDAKLKQSLALFQEQEQFKQDKVAAYAKRMGVQIPSQDNEQMEPQGMPEQSEGEIPMVKHGGMMNYMAMGGIQESGNQTDPGKLSDIQRQLKVVKQQISTLQPDSQYVSGNLGKLREIEKNLTIRQNNHPEFKKAMGGRLPMYQYGTVVPKPQQGFYKNPSSFANSNSFNYNGYIPENNYMQIDGVPAIQSTKVNPYTQSGNMINTNLQSGNMINTNLKPGYGFEDEAFFDTESNQFSAVPTNNNNSAPSFFNRTSNSDVSNPVTTITATDARKQIADQTLIPQNKNNNKAESFMKEIPEGDPSMGPMQKDKTFKKRLPQYFPEPEGFDWANAGKQAGQFALQNAGNLYDLYRSTQDNSKLNLARYSPTLLDKTQDLANNQRMYSEGKRQTAEASQGNASTYLNNMYANRASKLASDLNVNTTYGNLNAQIANAAKLYNAGAIDKETMFKLQAEGMNRNLKGQALAGMSQNFLNQRNSDRQDDLDQQRLGLQKQYYKAFYDNQDRENQRRVDEITKGKSNKNSWLDCSSGNCVERTSDQTQSTQSTPLYFNQTERPDNWYAVSRLQKAQDEMDKLKKGKK